MYRKQYAFLSLYNKRGDHLIHNWTFQYNRDHPPEIQISGWNLIINATIISLPLSLPYINRQGKREKKEEEEENEEGGLT